MTTMTRQLGEIETTSREALPMMQKMVATLDEFVKLDMPFLPEERTNRIAALKDMMTRADVSVSEKYRRIVEAYQIEIEYGRTIEAYQGKVGRQDRGLPARRPRRAAVPDARRQGDRLLGRRRARSGCRTTATRKPSRPASRSPRNRPRRISSVVPVQRAEGGEVMNRQRNAAFAAAVLRPSLLRCCPPRRSLARRGGRATSMSCWSRRARRASAKRRPTQQREQKFLAERNKQAALLAEARAALAAAARSAAPALAAAYRRATRRS